MLSICFQLITVGVCAISADGMAARRKRRYFMQAGLSEKGTEKVLR
jgi:hypothetical protein